MKSIVICDSTLVGKEDAKVLKNEEGDTADRIDKVNGNLEGEKNFSLLITSEKNVLHEEDDQLEITHEEINKTNGSEQNVNEKIFLKKDVDVIKIDLEKDTEKNSPEVEEGINLEEEVKVLYSETDKIKFNCEAKSEISFEKFESNQSEGLKENNLKIDKKMEFFENIDGNCLDRENNEKNLTKQTLDTSEENKENELKETKHGFEETLKKKSEAEPWSQDCQILEESEKSEMEYASEKKKNNVNEISSSTSPVFEKFKNNALFVKESSKEEEEEPKKQGDRGSIVMEIDENEEVMECDTEGISPVDELKVENEKQKRKNSAAVIEYKTKNNSVEKLETNSTILRKRLNAIVDDGAGGKKQKLEEKKNEDQTVFTEESKSTKTCSNVSAADSTPSQTKEENNCCQERRQPESEEEKSSAKEGKPNSTIANSSFLANLRGTLKTLTRSDLEELIIQKLCEVITERSTMGELRRKAQSVEQDLEKWKTKAQSLSKQMREMEMVMKKYMSEVQKQIKDGNSQVVVPLKVTRSVGLQVSFFSNGNKNQKGNTIQNSANSSAQNMGRSPKPSPSTIQNSVQTPDARNKTVSPNQKPGATPQKQKRPSILRANLSKVSANRSPTSQSATNNVRSATCETPKPNAKSQNGQNQQSPHMQQQQSQIQQPQHQKQQFQHQLPVQQNSQQQQQQQELQSSSKVIDLTDDDDKQSSSVVKSSGPIRVINHAPQQPQISQNNNRMAYLLPPAATSPSGQNRQVLLAAPTLPQPNRNLMSLPPLLYKGGNPAAPGPQPPIINQNNNRVIFPKVLRHPAPLPPQPVNQCNKPSLKLLPPRPALKISKVQTGIVLSWNMSLSPEHAPISSYQLYAYQESNSPPATNLWKKVGDVKALPLPMACTLTQFMSGHKYHFAVRAVDLHSRTGPFSFPGTIVLVK